MSGVRASVDGMTPKSQPMPVAMLTVVGLVAALLLSIGGAIATLAGNGFSETLGDPGEVGGFAGPVIQIVGLAIALPAGIVAAKRSSRRAGVAARPRGAS
jgi:hypothetical protein